MVEDLTVALGRLPWLFVIGSRSAFTYKQRSVDVRQIGRELGVRYALSGSVRKEGTRIRITAQLADTTDGGPHHDFQLKRRREEILGGIFVCAAGEIDRLDFCHHALEGASRRMVTWPA